MQAARVRLGGARSRRSRRSPSVPRRARGCNRRGCRVRPRRRRGVADVGGQPPGGGYCRRQCPRSRSVMPLRSVHRGSRHPGGACDTVPGAYCPGCLPVTVTTERARGTGLRSISVIASPMPWPKRPANRCCSKAMISVAQTSPQRLTPADARLIVATSAPRTAHGIVVCRGQTAESPGAARAAARA